MVHYIILYRGGIERKVNVLSDVYKHFREGDNLVEVHVDGEKVLIRSQADLDFYKSHGFEEYMKLVKES